MDVDAGRIGDFAEHMKERETRAQGVRFADDVLAYLLASLPPSWVPSRRGRILSAFAQHGYAAHDPYAVFVELEAHGRRFHLEIHELLR